MSLLGPLLILGGAISLGSAIFNWEWFFHSSKSRVIVSIFGRSGARIFYGLFGTGIMVFGAMYSLGFFGSGR